MITPQSLTRRTALVSSMLARLSACMSAEPFGPELAPKQRDLLIKEMIQVEMAMHEVFSAIVQERHDSVIEKGQVIHDSVILEQSLTEADHQDLHAAVPSEFLQNNACLQQISALLADAGREQDTRRQMELFGRMNEACLAFHSAYLTDSSVEKEAPDSPAKRALVPEQV